MLPWVDEKDASRGARAIQNFGKNLGAGRSPRVRERCPYERSGESEMSQMGKKFFFGGSVINLSTCFELTYKCIKKSSTQM
jgi:hypothetical protein